MIRALAELVSGVDFLLGLQRATILLCPLTWTYYLCAHGLLVLFILYRFQAYQIRAPALWPLLTFITSLKVLSPNITLGVMASTCELGEGGTVKPTTAIYQQIKNYWGASLVARWLGVCLLVQGTRVRALVWEDPTCRGAAGPVSHSCWACASGACAPQRERPQRWEARALRWGVAPTCRGWKGPSHRGEDPTQP